MKSMFNPHVFAEGRFGPGISSRVRTPFFLMAVLGWPSRRLSVNADDHAIGISGEGVPPASQLVTAQYCSQPSSGFLKART